MPFSPSPIEFVTFASHDERESPVNYSKNAATLQWIYKLIWCIRVKKRRTDCRNKKTTEL
jgi:hypothetical protein